MSANYGAIRLGQKVLGNRFLCRVMAPFTAGCGIIFTLHRVKAADDYVFQPNKELEITPEFLEEVILHVRREGYDIVSLQEAVERINDPGKRSAKRFATFTFDDGYRDNRDVAFPILKKHGVPLTVFICSGLNDRSTQPWWLVLERLVRDNERFELEFEERSLSYDMSTLEAKTIAYRELRLLMISELDEHAQRRFIVAASQAYGFDIAELCKELVLDWDELREWAKEPLVSFEAHTFDHHAMARLSEGERVASISLGMERMQQELGLHPRLFAYPYGGAWAVDDASQKTVEALDFTAAVTTKPGVLKGKAQDNLFALPRVSLNGYFQDLGMLRLLMAGHAFVVHQWVTRLRTKLKGA
ncbi:polysaccharide deacetylase [Rhodobacteraceae bacterium RKSG542]|uniref:polysaccharide deacetylase family protein n=1 Tax=Pseudovibrio flavus TaxID=2529854 RepID=UPI0012BBA2F7|nr:polysaccharide deacetylase family protein [Pseudovibrio flavus]MTI17349.1 polysaccharide deacetylase [Pseudovibrio flavus]